MFRNYLIATLRNLARNKLYSGISIFTLAIGLCAAILAGLVIRNQLSYDQFIPAYERTYLITTAVAPAGRAPMYQPLTNNKVASLLKAQFGEIEAVTRIEDQEVILQHGQVKAKEKIYWADPNVFELLTLPALAGELKRALQRPDSIVLTRSMARKYFGRDDPIGATLQLFVTGTSTDAQGIEPPFEFDHPHPMIVTAVIEDLPNNGTQLESGIFASGLASYSQLSIDDNRLPPPGFFGISVRTYLRVKPHASSATIQRGLPALMKTLLPSPEGSTPLSLPPFRMELLRLDKVHLSPFLNPGIGNRISLFISVGVLVLFIGCVVFVNLSTACSLRRTLEVGIRKVSGASRAALMCQFLGESVLYVLLALCLAAGMTECLLPYVNAFLNAGATFNYWREPMLLVSILLTTVMLGVVAGIYPALIISAFRPVTALKGQIVSADSAVFVRQALVGLQFAVLIGLLIAMATVYQQRQYAMHDALRVNTDQVLIARSKCGTAFKNELTKLSGIKKIACSDYSLLSRQTFGTYRLKDDTTLTIDVVHTELGVFDIFGLKPLAGNLSAETGTNNSNSQSPCVINQSAVRALGFASAVAAIGQAVPIQEREFDNSRIVAVVPDFAIDAVTEKVRPALYVSKATGANSFQIVNMQLTGKDIPETLAAIDKLWTATGSTETIDHFFLNDYIEKLYLTVLRQAQAFGAFACVAIILACLGLIGLAASAAQRRTKEIGIRKAMGADTREVMRLLLWQFTKPVLWANLIAWPIAGYFMNRWLHGFAYHIELSPWLFIGATGVALVMALLTVSVHCYLVARAKPIHALRYE